MMIGAELPYGARFIFWRRQPVFPESLSTTPPLTWIRSFGGAQPAAAPVGARSELKSISGKEKPRTIAATVLCGPRLAGAESGLFVRVKLGNAGRGSSTLAPKAAQSMTFCRLSPQSSERAKSVPRWFPESRGKPHYQS